MKKLLLLSAIALLSISSGIEKKTDLPKILDFDIETTTINPSEILETKYIKLETSKDCLVGSIGIVEFTDKYIFILDDDQEIILAFEHSGKYIGEVGQKGRGPEEIIYPESFFINEKEGYIAIVDGDDPKINYYSLTNNFEFISSSRSDFYIGSIEVTENGNLICDHTNLNRNEEMAKKHFLVLDKDLKPINLLVDKNYITGYLYGPSKPIYKNNGDIFGYTQYEPVVYKLSEDGATPFYTITFGGNTTPPLSYYQEEIGENNRNHFSILFESKYVFYYDVQETPESLLITYKDKDDGYIGFWDKKTDKTYSYDRKYFAEKMDIGASPHVSGVVSNYFVASLSMYEIKAAQKDGAKINNTLAELIKDSKKDDNPILFMFKTK